MSAVGFQNVAESIVAIRCPNCGREATIHEVSDFVQITKTVSCKYCVHRKLHKVNWPEDAYYRVEVCGGVLWGWSRDHFISIRDFIASKDRDLSKSLARRDLRRLPAQFLNVKRRATVIRAMDRLLPTT